MLMTATIVDVIGFVGVLTQCTNVTDRRTDEITNSVNKSSHNRDAPSRARSMYELMGVVVN